MRAKYWLRNLWFMLRLTDCNYKYQHQHVKGQTNLKPLAWPPDQPECKHIFIIDTLSTETSFTQYPSHKWISNSVKLHVFKFSLILVWSQWNFAHSKTAMLSWYVQNFIAIRLIFLKQWCKWFSPNLVCAWNSINVMDPWHSRDQHTMG